MKPAGSTKKRASRPIRAVGYSLIGLMWAGVLALLLFFGICAAIYSDLKSPHRCFLTRGSGLEPIARQLYLDYFRPGWQNQVSCVEFDAELVYVPRVGDSPFAGPEFDQTMRFDPDGLRYQGKVTDAGQKMIVVTGDSQAMGWGVADEETFSALLSRRYHLHTVNTAVSSYGTARELLRLRRMGLLEKADGMIIQYCENDVAENRAFLADPAGFIQKRDPRELWAALGAYKQSPVTYPLVSRLVWQSLRAKAQKEGLRKLIGELLATPSATAPTGQLNDTPWPSAEMAADFVAVLDHFPELKGKPMVVIEINDWGGRTGFIPELQRLLGERPNWVPLPLSFERTEFRRFDNHLNPAGHEKVADTLSKAIRTSFGF